MEETSMGVRVRGFWVYVSLQRKQNHGRLGSDQGFWAIILPTLGALHGCSSGEVCRV